MKSYIQTEILNGGKYNILSLIRNLMSNINKRFLLIIRLYLWSYERKIPFLTGHLYRKLILKYGCFIGPNAKIGMGIQFPHPNGIVIGDGTIIGNNCIIYQQVTLGGRIIGDAQRRNYPRVGNNVVIFAGAKIIGGVKIGDNVIIGANSVVNKDMPADSIVAGVPAKIIKKINTGTP